MRTLFAFALFCASAFAQATTIPASPAPPFVSVFNAGTADAICALGGDTIAGLTCQASSATTITAFATTVTIPAGSLSSNAVPFTFALGGIGSASPPQLFFTVKLDSVTVFAGTNQNMFAASVSQAWSFTCQMSAPSAAGASAPVITTCSASSNSAVARNMILTPTAPSVAIAPNAAHVLSISVTFSAATAGSALWLQSINHL